MSRPPTMTAVLSPISAPKARKCSDICTQSSRVGDRIIAKNGEGLCQQKRLLIQQFLDDGCGESQCLTTSCLSKSNNVLACKSIRKRLFLDGCWMFVAELIHSPQQLIAHSQLLESNFTFGFFSFVLFLHIVVGTIKEFIIAMLDVSRQLKAIQSQLTIMKQLKYKLNNQLRHFKQLRLFTTLIKGTQRSLPIIANISCADVKMIDSLPVSPIVQSLKNNIQIAEILGERLKEFIRKILLVQFATLGIASVAVLHFYMGKIKKKLDVVLRVQLERSEIKSKAQKNQPKGVKPV